ncbi:MAG: hypothetical protein E7L00_10095 [Propionibacteriaceae bacterium]|nr:hypothetical protein [Propionibacteriaceae bacterium]
MGLAFQTIDEWRKWQASRRRIHVLKDVLLRRTSTPTDAPDVRFWARGDNPALLIACDSDSPTNHFSLLAPLERDGAPAVVAHPAGVDLSLDQTIWRPIDHDDVPWSAITSLASIGDHLPVGAWAHGLANTHGWQQWVVQHGLLTPFSPPPPRGATVLTWSDADAAFLREGRPDLQCTTVGSPLLYNAARHPAPHVSRFAKPVFLGQLHGAELSRASMTRSVTAFWKETGATYRPHPREEDKLSRAQHALWQRMGMEISTGGALAQLNRPVVAAFSTGILEAAARGIPAWVYHQRPPSWLEEFWSRYAMARWGGRPTPAPEIVADPAARIASTLTGTNPL